MALPTNWTDQLSCITRGVKGLPGRPVIMKTSRTTGSIDPEIPPVLPESSSDELVIDSVRVGDVKPSAQTSKALTRNPSSVNGTYRSIAVKNLVTGAAQQRAFENFTNKQFVRARKIISDESKFERRQRTRSQTIHTPISFSQDNFQNNYVAETVLYNARKENHNIPILPKSKLPREISFLEQEKQNDAYWN